MALVYVTFFLNILTMMPWLWKRAQVLSHGKAWFGLDPSKQLPGRLKNSKVHVIVIFSTLLRNPSSIFYIEINYI